MPELSTLTSLITDPELASTTLFSDANLQVYYKFDNANDSKGANHLTETSAPTYTSTGAKFGNCASFTPNNELTRSDFVWTRPFSISFWIKPTLDSTYRRYIANMTSATDATTFIIGQNNDDTMYVQHGADQTSGTWLITGVWNHVVVIASATTITTYVNGRVVMDATADTSSFATGLFIGGHYGEGEYFNGSLDDISYFNDALSAAEVFTLYKRPHGYWKLENVNDSSDFGYNLTNNGTTTFVTAKFSNGASFNGSSKYLSIANASCPNLEITGSQTWVCWVKGTDLSASGDLMIKGYDSARRGLIAVPDAVQFFIPGLTTNAYVQSDAVINTTGYTFVCGVYDSTNTKLRIWINNTKKEVTASGSATANTQAFCIGADGDGTDLFFNGIVDDAAIFNRALTDAEVLSIYQTTSSNFFMFM